MGITTKLVERLLKAYPNAIAGMKDSSGDWNNTKTFLDAFEESGRSGRTGFDVFVGSETFLLANMRNGGAGTISATANVNPAAIYELYAACVGQSKFENRESKLEQHQARLNVVREVFEQQEISVDDCGIETGDCDLRERAGMGQGAAAAGRAFTTERAKLLSAELKAIGFTMKEIRNTES